jgi:hypothetical protein
MMDEGDSQGGGHGRSRARSPEDHESRSGADLVEALRRWEDFGAVWRVLDRDATAVTIGLFRCDAGEEVGRLVSGAAELVSFVDDRRPGGPAVGSSGGP